MANPINKIIKQCRSTPIYNRRTRRPRPRTATCQLLLPLPTRKPPQRHPVLPPLPRSGWRPTSMGSSTSPTRNPSASSRTLKLRSSENASDWPSCSRTPFHITTPFSPIKKTLSKTALIRASALSSIRVDTSHGSRRLRMILRRRRKCIGRS